jgi:bla regulator protein blaR1
LKAEIAAKVQSQIATPGSEAALRRLLTGSLANVSPELTQIIQSQSPRVQPMLTALGAVQSIEFRGVGNSGWDVYDVKYEHGTLQWRVALSSSGIVTGAMAAALP